MNPFMASLPGTGMGHAQALGALNAIQPPPPPSALGGMSLLQMLGGLPNSAPSDPGNILDPMTFGQQAGMMNPDPFASMPFRGSQPMVDQLEGMGLGSAPGAMAQGGGGPDLSSLLGGNARGY